MIEQARRGDRDAFVEVLRPELPQLQQSAYYLARDADEANDPGASGLLARLSGNLQVQIRFSLAPMAAAYLAQRVLGSAQERQNAP